MAHRFPAGTVTLLAAVSCLCAVQVAHAQYMYSCVDKHGRKYTGSDPPPECRDVDVRELNVDGSVHRVIPAPLTREQKAQHEAEEHKKILEEEQERAQASRDRSLLETYSSADEIDAARQRALAGQKTLIDRADQRIKQYEHEKKRLDDEAEFYVKRDMPAKLKDEFAINKTLTDQQQQARTRALKEIEAVNQRFDAEKKRYEELEKMAQDAQAARERMESQQQNN